MHDSTTATAESSTPRRWGRNVVTWIAVLIALPVLWLAAAIAVMFVPNDRITDQLVVAIDTGAMTAENYPFTGLGEPVDRFAECFAFTIGLSDPEGVHPVTTAIRSTNLGPCDENIPSIMGLARGAELGEQEHWVYYRYWHGYSVVTRPGLALFGVTGLRAFALTLVVASAAVLAYAVGRRVGPIAPILLIAPLVLTTDLLDLHETVPHAIAMSVALLGAAAAWEVVNRWTSARAMGAVAIASGSAFVFVDLLTVPGGAWALTSVMVIAAAFVNGWRGRKLATAAALGIGGWIVGYAFTWLAKWFFAGLVVGFGTVADNVRGQVEFRTRGEYAVVNTEFLFGPWINYLHWLGRPLGKEVLVAGLLLAVGLIVWARVRANTSIASLVLLMLPTVLPFIWYEVLSNHNQIHIWLTYRSVAMALGTLLFATFIAASASAPGPVSAGRAQVDDVADGDGPDAVAGLDEEPSQRVDA